MTEKQARKKWCPIFTSAVMIIKSQSNISEEGIKELTKCNASDCMMWKEVHPLTLPEDDPNVNYGYCGLISTT